MIKPLVHKATRPSPDGNGILLYLVFLQDVKDRMYSWKKLQIKL